MASIYRLYMDETGDHTPCVDPTVGIGKRYLGFGAVIFRRDDYPRFAFELDDFKKVHLHYDPDDPPILHRDDILNARGPFHVLRNPAKRAAFDTDLLALMTRHNYVIVALVLDKYSHGQKDYRALTHCYHYALLGMLQRYCGWLAYHGVRGDLMAESRGTTEDRQFKKAYRGFHADGGFHLSRDRCQQTLSSAEAKLKKKTDDIAGLQLADVLAHPLTRDVLLHEGLVPDLGSAFAARVVATVQAKYNYRYDTGKISGYGRVLMT